MMQKLLLVLSLFLVVNGWGQISYTTAAVAYTQNFDNLYTTVPANNTTQASSILPSGWVFTETGTNANTTLRNDNGSSGTGDTYLYGATNSNERAFGSYASGSLTSQFGASFTNNTGSTLTQITISYTGEQWRDGGSGTAVLNNTTFAYSIGATSLTVGTYTNVTQLDFLALVNNTSADVALDGNLAANQRSISYTITGLSWANGTTIFIRWSDANETGNDDGLAIDNFSFTASSGYFRSKQSGNWSSTSTWESSPDNSSWINATLTPTSSANTISVLALHTVTMDANTSVSNTNIAATGALNVAPGIVLTIPSGKTITNTGTFTLKSDGTGTASIGNSAGSISGTVTTEKYISGGGLSTDVPSTRAYRFISHPFSSSIALSQLQTSIDITGTGTGFDGSTTGNPSAFSWNGANANGATGTSNNNGWSPFTSTSSTTWAQYQGLRVFYRGTKGTGLNGSAYTVGSATLSMTGTVNTGDKTINLSYPNTGTFTNLNLIGNPYASNVQMSGVTNTNTTSSYYVWNLALGNRGGYSTVSFGSAYVLPAYAAFFAEASSAAGSLLFHETDKTASAATNSLLRTMGNNQLVLQLRSNNVLWDELLIESNKGNTAAKEYADARKLMNPDASLYTLSSDNAELAIDKRNIQQGDIVPLGLATGVARSFTIETKELSINNVELYLHDKYLDVLQKIEAGSIYSFSTDANAASQGNARFEIVAKQAPALPAIAANTFSVKLSPNPASDMVKVSFSNEEQANTTIILTNVEGKTVRTMVAGNVQTGQVSINVKGLAKGSYYVTLNNGKQTKTEKLQVQ